MLLREIPALPFDLDLPSATEWLDSLPVGNIRECSRLLFPVMQALHVQPMDAQLRFHVLERCHPIVFGIARGIQPHILGRLLPQDAKTRKIAGLASRIHLEAAKGYQHLVETEAFVKSADGGELLLALRRALEHLAHSLLRSAQVHELPPSSVGPSLSELYRFAQSHGLLDKTRPEEREQASSVRSWFARIALFRLAAPGRLPQEDILRFFDQLMLHTTTTGPAAEEGRGMVVFWHEPADIHLLVPGWPDSPPLPDLPYVSAKEFCQAVRTDLKTLEQPEHDSLHRLLPRVGERLSCAENTGQRRVQLSLGFDGLLAMLRTIEARRSAQGSLSETWASRSDLSLSPLGNLGNPEPRSPKFVGRLTLTDNVAADQSVEERRSVVVVPTEMPGFSLLDSGRWLLRTGLLAGLNSDDQSVQVGVIRAGQIRDGRFWHSWELLGSRLRTVRVARAGTGRDDLQDGILVYAPEGEISVILAPVKWRRDDPVTVRWQGEARRFRLAGLLEASPDFHQFALTPADDKPAST